MREAHVFRAYVPTTYLHKVVGQEVGGAVGRGRSLESSRVRVGCQVGFEVGSLLFGRRQLKERRGVRRPQRVD